MTTITIDNLAYDLNSLSTEASSQIMSIQLVDQKLVPLQTQLAAFQSALIAFANALGEALNRR